MPFKSSLVPNLISIIITIAGLIVLFQLNRASYPEVNFDILKITTMLPGANSEEIEAKVTHKIEDKLKDLEGIERIRSYSMENLSIVYTFLDPNSSQTKRYKDEIRRGIDTITDLPSNVDGRPYVEEIRSSNVSIVEVAVISDASESEQRKIADILETKIKEIKGVGQIEKIGYRDREIQIRVDQKKLQDKYLSLAEVAKAVHSQNQKRSAGSIDFENKQIKIITDGELRKINQIENLMIRSNFSGKGVKLGQLAEIEDSFEDPTVMARTNHKPSINLLIRSQGGSDIIHISQQINKLIKVLGPTLPPSVELKLVSDFSYYTDSLLKIVQTNAFIGMILVLICLVIFLTKWTAWWTAIGIPISLLGAIIFFPLFGITINFISLITLILVLGLLVDDAIVIAENITRHRELGLSPLDAAQKGVREMFWPVTATIATTILAFIPMLFMKGITGKFITEIPIIIILALLFSLFESTVILPAHVAFSPMEKHEPLKWFESFKNLYIKFLRKTQEYKFTTLLVFILFLLGCFGLFQYKMKFILFPYDDVDLFYIKAELPQESNLHQTALKMKQIEDIIDKILPKNQIQGHTTRIGHHNTNLYGVTQGLQENHAMVMVYLKPSSRRTMLGEEIMNLVEQSLKYVDGFDKLYLEKFKDGPPVGMPITVSVISDYDEVRQKYANQILDFLHNTQGIESIEADTMPNKKEIHVIPNPKAMSRFGITAQEISNTLNLAIDGLVVSEITTEGETIDYRVRLNHPPNLSPQKLLQNIQIPNYQGRLIPLKKLATLKNSVSQEYIRHYNSKRSNTITANINDNIISSKEANELIREKFMPLIKKNSDVDLIFGGEEKATKESMESFIKAFIISLIGIYFVLIILFNSWWQPFIIMAAIPFGLGGVIIVYYLHNLPISFLGIIGILGLIGIMVNDSLIMVSHFNHLKKLHKKLTNELILKGASERFRAVLLTTITTVAGMTPTIYGIGGSEPFIIPVVLSVAGGLVFATAITLILIPLLYSIFERKIHV